MKWISVKDRLPESSDNIVEGLTNKYKQTENQVLILTCNGKYGISKRTRFMDHDWNWSGSTLFSNSVTHWMPLPEPPKPE